MSRVSRHSSTWWHYFQLFTLDEILYDSSIQRGADTIADEINDANFHVITWLPHIRPIDGFANSQTYPMKQNIPGSQWPQAYPDKDVGF